MTDIKCTCGVKMPIDDLDYWNGCNELGEDINTIQITCSSCAREWNKEGWGEIDNKRDAAEILNDYINE